MNLKEDIKIFIQAFFQIGLVLVNTLLAAKLLYLYVFICSFCISLLWAFNVSKISISKTYQKFVYAIGAGTGAIVGMYSINSILSN